MYYYEDYMIKETPKAFVVSELFCESSVRIEKSIVQKFEADDRETEMIVILLAKIELIRVDSAKVDRKAPRSFLKEEKFQQKLEILLSVEGEEKILQEILEMKFHEVKEYFLGADSDMKLDSEDDED